METGEFVIVRIIKSNIHLKIIKFLFSNFLCTLKLLLLSFTPLLLIRLITIQINIAQ